MMLLTFRTDEVNGGYTMKPWIAALLVALAVPAAAQHHQHGHGSYAGMQHGANRNEQAV
jgi:hypothetical protein